MVSLPPLAPAFKALAVGEGMDVGGASSVPLQPVPRGTASARLAALEHSSAGPGAAAGVGVGAGGAGCAGVAGAVGGGAFSTARAHRTVSAPLPDGRLIDMGGPNALADLERALLEHLAGAMGTALHVVESSLQGKGATAGSSQAVRSFLLGKESGGALLVFRTIEREGGLRKLRLHAYLSAQAAREPLSGDLGACCVRMSRAEAARGEQSAPSARAPLDLAAAVTGGAGGPGRRLSPIHI